MCKKTMNNEWTYEDSENATKEHWDVWDCEGSLNGRWQIQAFDDDMGVHFKDDPELWQWLIDNPTTLRVKAIQFIKDNNEIEYNTIIKNTKKLQK